MEPLELATLAGLTSSPIEVEMFDDRIENIPYDIPADLVAITADTFTAKRAYNIASVFRKRNISVVMGGCHPTVMPDEAIQYCDSVVIGEAEDIWQKVLCDARERKLRKFYRASGLCSLGGRLANRDIFRGKRYLYSSLIEFGRGCKFNCTFCSIAKLYGNIHRHRPIKEVIEEIRKVGKRRIFFCDDNIVADAQAAKELFTAMIPLKVKWSSQASLNFVNDPELVRLMFLSGCWGLFVGFESLNIENLKVMRKDGNLAVKEYAAAITLIRNKGIKVWASFMFGWDNDTLAGLEQTLKFAISQKFFLANFNNLLPYPGTPLYEALSKEGRLLYDKWWLDDDFKFGGPSFKPRNFKPQELCEACYKARLRYNSFRHVFRRGLDFKANVRSIRDFFEFYINNFIFLKEVRRKQGMILGYKNE